MDDVDVAVRTDVPRPIAKIHFAYYLTCAIPGLETEAEEALRREALLGVAHKVIRLNKTATESGYQPRVPSVPHVDVRVESSNVFAR
jgi:hypothetical protein